MGAEEESKSGELPCSATVMRDTLAALDKVLDKHNLTHYVTTGTLLGLERDKDIIPWTGDVDMFIPTQAFWSTPAALRGDKEFAANYALKIWNHPSINFEVHKYTICIREGAPLAKKWPAAATEGDLRGGGNVALFGDLFMAREEEGHISNGGGCWFPKEWVWPLKRMKFASGMETWGVANAHEMLTANYGADYMTPPAKRTKFGGEKGEGDKCKNYKKGHRLRPASELVM